MFDGVDRILRLESFGPVILAGLAWYGANWLIITPEVSTRLADLRYQPACLASLDGRLPHQRAHRSRVVEEAEHAARAAREAANQAIKRAESGRRLAEGLMAPALEALRGYGERFGYPGLADDARNLLRRPPIQPQSPALVPAPEPTPVDRATYCGCVVRQAIAGARGDFALYTSTLRLYAPESVAAFVDRLPGDAGLRACGPAPTDPEGRRDGR